MANGRMPASPADRVPTPDPTTLTTVQLDRGLIALRELLEARLFAQDNNLIAVQRVLDKQQEMIDAAILHITTLFGEKFDSVEKQFIERDKRTEQLSIADKTAIAAALQAQKEAAGAQNESNAASVTKQEAAFTKLLDQNQALFQTSMAALTTQLNDLKSKQDRGEGSSRGSSDLWGYIVGVIGVVIGVSMIIVTVLHGH
jgi:hypothetical protein